MKLKDRFVGGGFVRVPHRRIISRNIVTAHLWRRRWDKDIDAPSVGRASCISLIENASNAGCEAKL